MVSMDTPVTTDTVPMEDQEWGRAVLPSSTVLTLSSISEDASIFDNDEVPSTSSIDEIEEVEVAIVGGGLAGLAVAIGLQRSNIPCKVYERAPQLRSQSQGVLGLQANGLNALKKIHPDLPVKIEETGSELLDTLFTKIHADGTTTETLRPIGKEDIEKFGQAIIGITWHQTQQILASMLPANAVVTGRSLASFQEEEETGTVLLEFYDTHSAIEAVLQKYVRAKVVIACDGVFSVARQQMMNQKQDGSNDNDQENIPTENGINKAKTEEDAPIYFGQLNWGTILETEELPEGAHCPNTVRYFSYEGEPARWMSMLIDGGSGHSFWQFRLADPAQAKSLSPSKGRGGLGLPGVKKSLQPFAEPCPLVANVLQCLSEHQIYERSIVGRLPADTWLSTRKRVALVGDSAHGMHPNIGQGANSAFESAWAIVHAMAAEWKDASSKNNTTSNNINWTAALKQFEANRKPKADLVQRWANIMGCYQATGDLPGNLDRTAVAQMKDWIVGDDSDKHPSDEVLEIIQSFDLLAQPGISKIV